MIYTFVTLRMPRRCLRDLEAHGHVVDRSWLVETTWHVTGSRSARAILRRHKVRPIAMWHRLPTPLIAVAEEVPGGPTLTLALSKPVAEAMERLTAGLRQSITGDVIRGVF